MKKDLTEIVMIIDESGSMLQNTEETYKATNRFIEEQKALPGDANFTLVFFDDRYRVIYDRVPISCVKPLTNEYKPTGMTALNDAVGKTITSIGEHLNKTPEDSRPEKVIFVVLTDGMENASKEYKGEAVKEMVKHQEDTYSWKFIYLAQNIDAFATGGAIGFAAARAYQGATGTKGYAGMQNVACAAVASYRTTGNIGNLKDYENEDAPQK